MFCPTSLSLHSKSGRYHTFLQVDLIGKGGPAGLDGLEMERDVRLQYVKVMGIAIPGLAIHAGRMSLDPSILAREELIQKKLKSILARANASCPAFGDGSDDPLDITDEILDHRQGYEDSFL